MNELVRFALVALFPREGELPGLDELDVEAKIVALRRESVWLFWTGVVVASILFQLTPIVTLHRPVLASMLTEEQLDRHAHGVATHRLYVFRQLMNLLKIIGGIMWGQSPEVRAFLALPPYPEDPGTRRTATAIAKLPVPLPRAPVPSLVLLGQREVERGR